MLSYILHYGNAFIYSALWECFHIFCIMGMLSYILNYGNAFIYSTIWRWEPAHMEINFLSVLGTIVCPCIFLLPQAKTEPSSNKPNE